jgi:hypothetical protein
LPQQLLDRVGPVTLAASVAGTPLSTENYSSPGEHLYQAHLPASMLEREPLIVEFELDKAIPPGTVDQRELGVIVIGVELD